MQKNGYRHSSFYLLILLAILIIAYWPISFYAYSLKNDALNYFLPVRWLVSESFHNGILPLWTPYLNLGYPLHGDMQSGVWNPIVQIFSLFGPYTLFTLHVETLLYIYLSGVGMFFLLKYFRVHHYANLMASVAYMLCGFNSDSCQFLNWIAAAAFLPFLFLFYYRCLKEQSVITAVYTGTILFLLFTCAYPADFIIAAYLLLGMFILYMIIKYAEIKKNPVTGKKILICQLLIIFVFLALSAPAILSYMQTLPLTERGSGASYQDAMSNSLHPLLIFSYTTPLAIWKMPGVSITDPLVRNSYMGIAGFVFLLCSFLISSRSRMIRLCRYAVIIFFLFSLGNLGGLRALCYYILPLMDTFRHPANARIFTIFFSCLLACFTFDAFIKNEVPKAALKRAVSGAIILSAAVLLWALILSLLFPHNGVITENKVHFSQYLKTQIGQMNFSEITLLTTLIQIPFLYLLWRWLIKSNKPLRVLQVAVVNSIVFCMLVQPSTVVKNKKASVVQSIIDSNAINGYPPPGLETSIRENSLDGMKYFKEIGVLNVYNKKIGRVDYRVTPSNLLSQNEFWRDTSFRENIINYPLIYRSDSINHIGESDIQVIKFLPNNFQFRIKNSSPAHYVLLQNYFPCWNIIADGRVLKPDKVNISFMGFGLPEGDHIVEFRYTVPGLAVSFFVSTMTLLIIISYLVIKLFKKRKFYSL